jgi:hypothetical protein
LKYFDVCSIQKKESRISGQDLSSRLAWSSARSGKRTIGTLPDRVINLSTRSV